MPLSPGQHSWLPTTSHLRAVLGGLLLGGLALVANRPDLLVLASPLVVIAVWSGLTRPQKSLDADFRLGHSTVREGEATTVSVQLTAVEGMRAATALVPRSQYTQLHPWSGISTTELREKSTTTKLSVDVRSTRWGRRGVGPILVAGSSAWAAYRWGPVELEARPQTTLPLPAVFDAAAPAPHPTGLVGLNRSTRPGSGSEFASIRPFQAGDRLRRIHWPVSMRTGALHVTATWADQDSQVVLVVDATGDLGISEGIEGSASSLDITVRAAGAISEHFLRAGDRVGLRVLGGPRVLRVPAAAGRGHLRRVLDTLAGITPGLAHEDEARASRLGINAGALCLMLSPLANTTALQHALRLARQGLTVIVVDTLPPDAVNAYDDPFVALAWRIRLLERTRGTEAVAEAGVPIVPWRGPGSLDQVLRDIGRRSSAPRLARR